MNIAILCYHRIGGSGIVAYEIGRAMAEDKGHNVHFMGLEPPFRLKDNDSEHMKFHRVCVKEYPVFDFQPYSLALASQLSTIINHYDIDVIHSHYALPHAVSALLARDISGKPIKCVTTLHGTDITVVGAHPSMKDITRYAIEKSDVVTAVSDSLARDSEEKLGITRGRIKTVYNFINSKFFNPSMRPTDCQCEGQPEKFVFMHISNLRAVKRPLDVIKIFHSITKVVDMPVELRIVGEGPMQCEMMDLSEKLGLKEQVKFMGVRSDIGKVIACSNMMLLPSREESFGLAALEAMACGVPVIASRVGGLPEVIEDGRSGFLFEMGDTDEAAAKAAILLKDRAFYSRMKEEALKVANEKFSIEKIVDQYEALYQKPTTRG
ncbi:MAG: N-acetyl-alpha-D-glucosaminyl L-malate synthase BshA [bacterium]|nr:N-acetyl-alpha-D-glucosaminyl L-malate synthase BshA [bacterium]